MSTTAIRTMTWSCPPSASVAPVIARLCGVVQDRLGALAAGASSSVAASG